MSTIIRGGTIVGPYGSAVTDLRIDGEQITALGAITETPGDRLIDAGGCLVLPGGIDRLRHARYRRVEGAGAAQGVALNQPPDAVDVND